LSFGSSGTGTPPHVAGELFKRIAGIEVVHIPYKGATPALMDLIGGRIAFTIDSPAMHLPQAKAGKVRALAVTGPKRLEFAPEVPTVGESGLPGYEYVSWMGIAAPAGTPKAIVARLNRELVKALKTPRAREHFAAQGSEPVGDSPEAFAAFIKAEHAKWGPIVREAGIRAE
jgi:tripartite-type tricarboxylate transporter receptor subunit TctC